MTTELSDFVARLRGILASYSVANAGAASGTLPKRQAASGKRQALEPPHAGSCTIDFDSLALELFALQFKHNAAYRKICQARGVAPDIAEDWTRIPAVPTAAFKELELSCLPAAERTAVFHSSGTTEQRPSRHFHSAESLALYAASLRPWFERHLVPDLKSEISNFKLIILTPPPEQAPHSSLVHMFETIRQQLGAPRSIFVGQTDVTGGWTLDFDATAAAFGGNPQSAIRNPQLILGTAFSFVHLLDFLSEKKLSLRLPAGSRVMETGGYKNRSRSMSKTELHELISARLGVPQSEIICEYGMSELSSQAYAVAGDTWQVTRNGNSSCHVSPATCRFQFPPWARVRIVSPETGDEVAEGETGLIRVFDLANVFSVMAVQTEDLGIRRGDGFELIGRAQLSGPRGCSLMSA